MNDDENKKLQQEIDLAPELDFDVPSEPWITIKVKDGAELKAKLVVKGVKRVSDEPNGKPRYFVAHDIIIRVAKPPIKVER
jgi:hypothetical protein